MLINNSGFFLHFANIYDVLDTINEKMIRRHPHVFGNSKATTEEEIRAEWEKIKAEEKAKKTKKKQ